ncbi:TPA: TonB-dependent hemoglobin/transferrin/lactoferrin family receptor [Vibrio parahaemolyticus]|uniref:TonB-dependent hemoglobin/transferrin/lactoferrin family receptor n=1 Tax=Vibrio parahaemolyticus TaxID=670 RepID=UPI002AC726B2|nr:TonB-dependent hemoglobin/transferrin/lactoferrin family receptor [Vibrio parahaemolyticus]MDZ5118394.1 TonB-dependent hemoglobin/transferrin/lactoferrin family receptor [Vibrio parahaemolyticus]HCG7546116.1 TonB-dependent hemoglobin/transferrin/lactoferrin family receptor [Vibrio parahaemolyticus]
MYNKSILSASILIVLSQGAYAEDHSTFNEVVVTATRTNSQIEDTAASVAVVTDKNIEESMVTGLDDLFEYTPGVTVKTNSRQGVQSINIRGIEGNRIKVLVDGVSQGNQFESGNTFINSARVNVDTDLIKAVEIVKGAASSLHGSDAIGGIVAFETKDPADFLKGRNFGGHAKFNYSSEDNTFSESVALANKAGDLESLVAYTRRDGNELDNFGDLADASTEANNLLVKLQYQVNDAHRVEFNGNYIRNKGNGKQSYNGYTNATSEDITEQYQVGIKHIWEMQTALADSLTWQLDWLNKEENGITDRVKGQNIQRKDYIYEDEGYQFDSQFDKYLSLGSTEHYFVYGASLSDKDIKNVNKEYNSASANKEIFYIPSASERRYGLFLQDEITVGNFTITPGVRWDAFETDPGDTSNNPSGNAASDYKKFSDSAFTGRLGSVYKLNEQHRLFAQISQGFRAPDFQELYYSFGNPMHGYIFKPNPDLKAEDSISYEFGWRHNNDISSSEVSVFYSDYDNFIESKTVSGTWTPVTDPAIQQYVNIGKATIKGIEFSNQLSWDKFMPIEGFSSRVAAAYTEGEDGNNNPLNSVNPWNLVAGFNYDSEQNWGTTLTINYTASKDKSDINDDKVLPISAATVVDITAYYKPIKDLTLRAGLFNVTDEEYYNWNDVRDLQTENKDLTQAGRNWSITAKYEF